MGAAHALTGEVHQDRQHVLGRAPGGEPRRNEGPAARPADQIEIVTKAKARMTAMLIAQERFNAGQKGKRRHA